MFSSLLQQRIIKKEAAKYAPIELEEEHHEKTLVKKSLFCDAATCLEISFMRLCSALVKHADELEVQHRFRGAVNAAMADLQQHHRDCPICVRLRGRDNADCLTTGILSSEITSF